VVWVVVVWGGVVVNPKEVCAGEGRSDGEFPDHLPQLPWEKGEEVELGCRHFRVDWCVLGCDERMGGKRMSLAMVGRGAEVNKYNLVKSASDSPAEAYEPKLHPKERGPLSQWKTPSYCQSSPWFLFS